MTKKSRYGLLIAGVIFFLICAPLLVMYIRGIAYDPTSGRFLRTGLLAVRSGPSDVEVYLDGKQVKSGQGDIRFLPPREYDVSLKREGYFEWDKRLRVDAGQVTWTNPAFGSVYLLLDRPAETTMATSVSDFYFGNQAVVYLQASGTGASLVLGSASLSLTKPANQILDSDGSGNYLLGQSGKNTLLVVNPQSGRTSDITPLFSQLAAAQFGPNGNVLLLSQNRLYSVDYAGREQSLVSEGVSAFDYDNGQLYYLKQSTTSQALYSYAFDQTKPLLLLDNLPLAGACQIQVNAYRQVFLLLDGSLYLANGNLQKLADNVIDWRFNKKNGSLVFVHSGELDYYSPLASANSFVTRASEALNQPQIAAGIGYALFVKNNQIYALELDARDHQNQYRLYQGQELSKFLVSDDNKSLWLLDSGQLKKVQIR